MNTLSIFRKVAVAEGISYILLVFIAMPLKYMLDMPLAVKYTGWAHGLLFVLYIGALLHAAFAYRWSIVKIALGFIASVLPFGTFVFDAKVVKQQQAKAVREKVMA